MWFVGYYYKGFGYIFHGKFPRESISVDTNECVLTEGKWFVRDEVRDKETVFKIFTYEESKSEEPEELVEPKVTKSVPEATLELSL